MILVTGHNFSYTDTDSVIGSIVLMEILKHRGYEARPVVLNPNGIQESTLDIMEKIGLIEIPPIVTQKDILANDIAIVDHNNPMESYGYWGIEKVPVVCIDHHTDIGIPIMEKRIESIGATCTILAKILREENIRVSNLLAKALVYAIACDTKGLKSRKVGKEDFEMIEYLYKEYEIDVEIDKIAKYVLSSTDVLNMTVSQLLSNSLKEYSDGKFGIASIEVLNDDFEQRMEEIKKAGWETSYPLFIFLVFKQHTHETLVYYFDRKYHCFPIKDYFDFLISRSKDIVPYVMEEISKVAI